MVILTMFQEAVIDYWGRHEECPLFGGDLSWMEFCCAQMLTERQAYDLTERKD